MALEPLDARVGPRSSGLALSGVRPESGRLSDGRPPHLWNELIRNGGGLARDVLCGGVVATVKSCTLVGIDAELVDVEYTIARGLPQYIEGLRQPLEERCVSIGRLVDHLRHRGRVAPQLEVAAAVLRQTVRALLAYDSARPGTVLAAALADRVRGGTLTPNRGGPQ